MQRLRPADPLKRAIERLLEEERARRGAPDAKTGALNPLSLTQGMLLTEEFDLAMHGQAEGWTVGALVAGRACDTGTLAQRSGITPAGDGDGQKFKGHGLIQITGHDNHLACSLALFGDDRLLQNPRLLCEPQWAAMSAGWFWDSRGLNAQADKNDLEGCTRRINGGLNGYAERLSYYEDAKFALM